MQRAGPSRITDRITSKSGSGLRLLSSQRFQFYNAPNTSIMSRFKLQGERLLLRLFAVHSRGRGQSVCSTSVSEVGLSSAGYL